MKLAVRTKYVIIEIIAILYILLFVYAAVSKLLDFENFQVQLGQSPLLSAYAKVLSWLIPVIELIIALALTIDSFRFWGLYGALVMMTLFTSYIYIILNFSTDVPCSCGGVLEKLGWTEHLIFNVIFMFLAIIGLWLSIENHYLNQQKSTKTKKLLSLISLFPITIILCGSLVWLLFQSSDYIINSENPFIRRFPTRPIQYVNQMDLKYNSYYIAGYGKGKIYLGNYTAPLHILEIDTTLTSAKEHKIAVDLKKYPIRSLKLKIDSANFYLMDGSVPLIITGTTEDWKGTVQKFDQPYFSKVIPMDSLNFVFRGLSSSTRENVLGLFNIQSPSKLKLSYELLQKQSKNDGIFDTDGHLTYSKELSKIIYVYAYKNQFIVADRLGKLNYRGKTIDTINTPRIKIAHLNNGTEKTMAVPPLLVNGFAVAYKHLLFVDSRLRGQYEPEKVSKRVSTFDVYDIKRNIYLMSFYLPGIKHHKFHSFYVTDNHIFIIINNQLLVYQIKKNLKMELEKTIHSISEKHTGQYQESDRKPVTE